MAGFRQLLRNTPEGLYCPPGDFHIDPVQPVDHAVITHGHSDHARAGHGAVLATPETLAIMRLRLGEGLNGTAMQDARYGEAVRIGNADVRLVPAALDHGLRMVVSGDYKRRRDPTCAPFEPVPCDVFITEATFGLPVFRHPATAGEVDRLLQRLHDNPERCVLVGAYALGKAQRLLVA